jgi:two-component system phosphate regulon sensor histidine kinase PhoR
MTTIVFLFVVLVLAVVVLIIRLWREAQQRKALIVWLRSDVAELFELPDGFGQWRNIFAALEQREKSTRRHAAQMDSALDRYRRAIEALPAGVVLLDATDHIDWLNESAADHLGIEPKRDLGTLIWQLARQPSFYEYLQAFRANAATASAGVIINGHDNSRTLHLQLRRFSDEGTLLLSRDISDSVRTEKMRRDFVANVSHELRTPATVISGFLEQMTSDEPPHGEDALRFLNLMADQSRRMNRLIEDLLTLSQLENAATPPDNEVVDVVAMLDTLVNEGVALSAGRHQIERGEVVAATISGSTDELRSAFGNLISNAIRYTPAGGSITVSWELEKDLLCFCVRDTGIGIPAEHIPRLTERFYRVDRGRSTATGGTGLGLAIVKHVLNRHQATLLIHSEPGRGSRFCVNFPQQRMIGK